MISSFVSPLVLSLQVLFFLVLGKSLSLASRLLKKGSGTSITGFYVERWQPSILRFFSRKYQKTIFVSGTNGKTTTAAAIIAVLQKSGLKVVSNKEGANILRGLAATLLMDLGWNLKPKSDILLLEVEEATLPRIKTFIYADYLILTNLFRDQLDAYGEIDKTLEYFGEFIQEQKQLTVLINGDDGKLVYLKNNLQREGARNSFILCGVDTQDTASVFNYETNIFERQPLDFKADKLSYSEGMLDFMVSGEQYTTKLPGVYNVYNLVFAIALFHNAALDKVSLKALPKQISEIDPVFGRGEVFEVGGNKIFLFLVKNPAGFGLVLDHVAKAFNNSSPNLVFLVNDKIADSKDVSWLWDVNFERTKLNFSDSKIIVKNCYTGGSRSLDMLLRLEYSGLVPFLKTANDLGSIDNVTKNIVTSCQGNTIVFATYTAMLEFRSSLGQYTKVKAMES
jgi:lipid II isoglutaminyl synthase (glutamine-hydrolysing)